MRCSPRLIENLTSTIGYHVRPCDGLEGEAQALCFEDFETIKRPLAVTEPLPCFLNRPEHYYWLDGLDSNSFPRERELRPPRLDECLEVPPPPPIDPLLLICSDLGEERVFCVADEDPTTGHGSQHVNVTINRNADPLGAPILESKLMIRWLFELRRFLVCDTEDDTARFHRHDGSMP